nr:MAG TPA: hypothetical protein [Caudoviricetes sp.]DAV54022.1 MAG TPA: hypothetical protein [Caudoviricetes sp.]
MLTILESLRLRFLTFLEHNHQDPKLLNLLQLVRLL